MIEGDPIDENMLHKILKDRRGLYSEVILPSGEVWKDYESISFHKMPENERTEYVTWALAPMSNWIDRKNVVEGKRGSVRLELCGPRIFKNTQTQTIHTH